MRSVIRQLPDLDLATIEGATAPYTRLKGAARGVCDQPATGPDEHRACQACYQAALVDAVAKINRPRLTAVDGGSNSRATATAMLVR